MKVLVACECSGVVRDAFIALGHDATSCDIQPTDRPGPHIEGDVLKVLADGWDLMIAHPPCTYLCVTGNKWMKPEFKDRFPNRAKQREDAVAFFMALANAPIPRIAVENPICIMSTRWRKPDQIIQPWQFGDKAVKKTCLWLKGLPPLFHTNIVTPEYVTYKSRTHKSGKSKYPTLWAGKTKTTNMPMLWKMGPCPERQKLRSVTFQGIANAMAKQWGDYK
jgi:hypothetical protein